jgi:thymidylate synthase (FAD)
MTILEQSARWVFAPVQHEAIEIISDAAASCFGSMPVDKDEHVRKIYHKHHLSVFEHVNITMQLRTDIATYKGLTRHRHCAFTIESTHYKAYKKGLNIIRTTDMPQDEMLQVFELIERQHQSVLTKYGKMAARSVLPQAQAAEVTMTTNLREWFHIFDLRKGKENTTNMWQLMALIMQVFKQNYPFFMDLYTNGAL